MNSAVRRRIAKAFRGCDVFLQHREHRYFMLQADLDGISFFRPLFSQLPLELGWKKRLGLHCLVSHPHRMLSGERSTPIRNKDWLKQKGQTLHASVAVDPKLSAGDASANTDAELDPWSVDTKTAAGCSYERCNATSKSQHRGAAQHLHLHWHDCGFC